jgi:hypothetical protein
MNSKFSPPQRFLVHISLLSCRANIEGGEDQLTASTLESIYESEFYKEEMAYEEQV